MCPCHPHLAVVSPLTLSLTPPPERNYKCNENSSSGLKRLSFPRGISVVWSYLFCLEHIQGENKLLNQHNQNTYCKWSWIEREMTYITPFKSRLNIHLHGNIRCRAAVKPKMICKHTPTNPPNNAGWLFGFSTFHSVHSSEIANDTEWCVSGKFNCHLPSVQKLPFRIYLQGNSEEFHCVLSHGINCINKTY